MHDLPQIDTTRRPARSAPSRGLPAWLMPMAGVVVLAASLGTWALLGPTIVAGRMADDLEEQYRLLVESRASQLDLGVRAGAIAEAALHAKDRARYREWKAVADRHMRAAGMPVPR